MRPKNEKIAILDDRGPLTTPPDSWAGPALAATAAANAKIDVPMLPDASQCPAAAGTAPSRRAGTRGAAAHRANRPDTGHRDRARDKATPNSRDESHGTRPAAACRTGTAPHASNRSDKSIPAAAFSPGVSFRRAHFVSTPVQSVPTWPCSCRSVEPARRIAGRLGFRLAP